MITLLLTLLHLSDAATAAEPDPSFLNPVRILLLLSGSSEASVRADPIAGELELRTGVQPKAVLELIKTTLQKSGAEDIQVVMSSGQTRITSRWNVPNLQATGRVLDKPRRLVVDLGSSLYLPPEQPLVPFFERLAPSFGRTRLAQAEQELFQNLGRTSDLLTRLGTDPSEVGFLAIIRLSDQRALAGDFELATRLARAAHRRATQSLPEVAPIAALRILSYGGLLFHPSALDQLGLRATDKRGSAWVDEEVLFQLARIHHARAEFGLAAERSLDLFARHPESRFRQALLPILKRDTRAEVQKLAGAGRHAQVVKISLLYLQHVSPIDPDSVAETAVRTARSMLKAGVPQKAAQVVLWFLSRTSSASKPPTDLLFLLAECFEASRDFDRLARTIRHLHGQVALGDQTARLSLIEGRLAERQGTPDDALLAYRTALEQAETPDTAIAAAIRSAAILRASERSAEALPMLRDALGRGWKKSLPEPVTSDAVLLEGDLGFELGRVDTATMAYGIFLRRYPEDPRSAAVRYRLSRLTGEALQSEPTVPGDDLWREASQILKQAKGKESP